MSSSWKSRIYSAAAQWILEEGLHQIKRPWGPTGSHLTHPSPDFLDLQAALAGEYSIERELVRGGMGTVYLAREVQLDLLERLLAHSVPAAYAPRSMSARNQRLDFRLDDLSGEPTRRLIARHLAGMHDNSPAGCVHALDADALRQSGVTFWSAWIGDEIAGCGALTQIDAARGELKSMRVADGFLGQGVGRALLEYLIAEAQLRGLESLWLETGSSEAFIPAIHLYESAGFARCGPFNGYVQNPFSIFMTRAI